MSYRDLSRKEAIEAALAMYPNPPSLEERILLMRWLELNPPDQDSPKTILLDNLQKTQAAYLRVPFREFKKRAQKWMQDQWESEEALKYWMTIHIVHHQSVGDIERFMAHESALERIGA